MIRPLRADDKAAFLSLVHTFYQTPAVAKPVPDSHHLRTFERIMRGDPFCSAYMIVYNGQSVGYGLVGITYSNEAGGLVVWLDELFILPEYRSLGLGKEFFAYLESHAPQDTAWIRLEIEPDNKRAEALYRKLGYERMPYAPMKKQLRTDK